MGWQEPHKIQERQMQSPWHRKDQTHILVHTALHNLMDGRLNMNQQCGVAALSASSTTGLQQQPVAWGKRSVPLTWPLLHTTWRAHSVSFSFGTRHMLINLIIFHQEDWDCNRYPSEVTLFAQAKEERASWDLRLFQYQYQYEMVTEKVDPVLLQWCTAEQREAAIKLKQRRFCLNIKKKLTTRIIKQ